MNSETPQWRTQPEWVDNFAGQWKRAKNDSERKKTFIELLWVLIGCDQEITREFISDVIDGIALFDYKQQRYGTGNIAKIGELGLNSRVSEKVARIENMLKLVPSESPDRVGDGHEIVCYAPDEGEETRRESWIDIGVQGFMGCMVYDGRWPGCRDLRLVELPRT